MPDNTIILEALDIQDAAHWCWRLTALGGTFLADHAVSLDSDCWQYQAMLDLYGHLRRHADPDRRTDAETTMLGQLGAWLGAEVLGPVAAALVERTPVTVRVRIPDEPATAGLFALPLELAHASGKPLAVQDVSLVFEAGPPAGRSLTSADRLRILAVFSLPQGEQSLNLRQERYQLKQLLNGLTARRGGAVDLRVLQYGVTRQMLKDLLEEGDGWDVLHFSGHGCGDYGAAGASGRKPHVADCADSAAARSACRSVAGVAGAFAAARRSRLAGAAVAESGPTAAR